MYSLPLTRSSASVSRSLRSRGLEARETVMRSSSLSTQAAAFSSSEPTPSLSEFTSCERAGIAD